MSFYQKPEEYVKDLITEIFQKLGGREIRSEATVNGIRLYVDYQAGKILIEAKAPGKRETRESEEKILEYIIDSRGYRNMLYPTPEKEFRRTIMGVFGVKRIDDLVYQVLFIPNDSNFLKHLQKGMASTDIWFKIVDSNAHNTAIKVITDTVHDKFTEVIVQFDELSVRKEIPGRGPIYPRVYDLGDGIERVLTVILWLETFKPKIVLWDDIEVAAHPGLIESVLRWLSSRDWQVIISTHSFDVLDRLVAIRPKDASVVVLSKDSSDRLTCKVLELDEVEEYFSKGIDIRKTLELL